MTDPAAAFQAAVEAVVAPVRLELEVLRDRLRELERERERERPRRRLVSYAAAAQELGVSHRTFQRWAAAREVNGLQKMGVVVGSPPRVDPTALREWWERRAAPRRVAERPGE